MTDRDELGRLAAAYGVLTHYDDWASERVDVAPATVVRTLAALGVDASSAAAVRAATDAHDTESWRRLVAPTVVLSPRRRTTAVTVPAGATVTLAVELENGGALEPAVQWGPAESRTVDGTTMERRLARLPDDLPSGYHRLQVSAAGRTGTAELVVAPGRCPSSEPLGRTWGWMVQLYAARSTSSWGVGDYRDLAELCRWAGAAGADFVLCNPLHAAAPTLPQVSSPYSPVSRRFHATSYLRVADVPEVARLAPAARERLDRLARAGAELNHSDLLDRDALARLQRDALELLHAAGLDDARAAALAAYRTREGRGLEDFATWCALAERHGADWREWPRDLRHPTSAAVAAAREDLRASVDLHVWLQWLCDEQLAAAQRAATDAGQRVGVVHDLAVGVAPGGADAWALQDDIAAGMSVGAPPDSFNQRGQDWALPPLRPDRLAATGYAAFRDMLRSVLRHAGGIRIDHAMGLFRLYWIGEGCSPADGTYVRYPADDMLAVLALEATRAAALVVAEDLGTVEEGVPEALELWGAHGSAVLWFERGDDGPFRRAADYRAATLASVTTHDLPTARGFWTGEATRVRDELGQLGADRTREQQEAADDEERAALRELLEAEGLARPDADVEELVEAMHVLLARSPSRLLGVALSDALGEVRQPNLPGTQDEYPNWRLPLPVPLDDVADHPGVRRMVELMRAERTRPADAP